MSSSGPSAAELDHLNGILNSSRTWISAITAVAVWEAVVTFPAEYKYVWRADKKFLTIMYIINRYWCIIVTALTCYSWYWPGHTPEQCSHFHLFQPYGSLVALLASQSIFIARLYAIWERNRILLICLCCMLAIQFSVQVWNPAHNTYLQLPPGFSACIPGHVEKMWIWFITAMINDTITFILSLYKVVTVWREGGKSHLITVIWRDGVVFFALCMIIQIFNLIWYFSISQNGNRAFMAPLVIWVTSMAAGRVVLNLRAAACASQPGSQASHSFQSFGSRGPNKPTTLMRPSVGPTEMVSAAPVAHVELHDLPEAKEKVGAPYYELEPVPRRAAGKSNDGIRITREMAVHHEMV